MIILCIIQGWAGESSGFKIEIKSLAFIPKKKNYLKQNRR